MTLEDRIRQSVDAAVTDIRVRIEREVRALLAATEDDRQHILRAARDRAARDVAAVEAKLGAALEVAERRIAGALADADRRAAEALERSVMQARAADREAELARVRRLLDSVRGLDGATSLLEVLDALGQSAAREAARAAVLVVRDARLQGWSVSGFGPFDLLPKSLDLDARDGSVISRAVESARAVATSGTPTAIAAPAFAELAPERMGLAVPVLVGGRVVAVVYADDATPHDDAGAVSGLWPETIEVLARHASRCLEALTAQKAVLSASPRFWVSPTDATATPGGDDEGGTGPDEQTLLRSRT